jgi:hypothetical protein
VNKTCAAGRVMRGGALGFELIPEIVKAIGRGR